jgi:hypothetical protein
MKRMSTNYSKQQKIRTQSKNAQVFDQPKAEIIFEA